MASKTGAIIFAAIIILAFMIGDYIIRSAFFGILTLIGLIALVESISILKWVLSRTSKFLDIMLFAFTIAATASYGLNIASSLTIAGIGYTLVYAPYLREQREHNKTRKKNHIPNNKNNYNSF